MSPEIMETFENGLFIGCILALYGSAVERRNAETEGREATNEGAYLATQEQIFKAMKHFETHGSISVAEYYENLKAEFNALAEYPLPKQ